MVKNWITNSMYQMRQIMNQLEQSPIPLASFTRQDMCGDSGTLPNHVKPNLADLKRVMAKRYFRRKNSDTLC